MLKTVKNKLIYQNTWLKFYEDQVVFPNGEPGIYGYAVRKNGVALIIADSQHNIVLIKQYRYPIKSYQWGVPGGGIDNKETAKQAAIREAFEETGLILKAVEPIGTFYPLSSHINEKIELFFARVDNIQLNKAGEKDEDLIESKLVNINVALKMVDDGEIDDATTANAIQIVARRFKK